MIADTLWRAASEPGELDATDNVFNGVLPWKKCEHSPLRANSSKLVQLQNQVLSGKWPESRRSSLATISCVSEKNEPVAEAEGRLDRLLLLTDPPAAGRFTEGTERDNQ